MLKNTNKYQTLLAVCLLTLLACSTNETLTDSPIDQSKTPIELTAGIIGENAATTRGLTRTVTNTAEAFSKGTSLYMVIKSENGTSTTPTQFTRTIGYAQELATTPESSTATGFASTYKRYWEDTQSPARDSKLSIYAACVPDYYLPVSVYPNITPNGTADGTTPWSIGGSTDYSNDWNASLGATTIAWPLRGTAVGSQDATFLANQDLCFSNNVSKQSTTVDNRLKFDDDTKKFTSGRMVFHHALTKVTFKIKKGNGFESASFAFTSPGGENIVLKGFNSYGTLDISSGEFGSKGTTDITSLADTKTSADAAYDYVLTCLMLPGSALTSTATDEVYFTIDNNKYHITKAQLATALNDKTVGSNLTPALTDDKKMRPGVHYVFTMTVSKSQISNLSAAVVGWEEVTASTTPSNARISVSLLENGTAETSTTPTFDLFRSANVNEGAIDDNYTSYTWAKGYEKATLSYNSTTGAYVAYNLDGTTPWYWPNNRTFYHFRTLKPQTTNTWKVETGGTNPNTFEYVTLEGGLFNDTPEYSYRDVCWGAPFKSLGSGQKLTYSLTTGFDNTGTGDLTDPANHQISKAIGPTTSTINMNTFHMMSDVTINLTTTTGSDKVTLTGATVKLTPVYNTGTVRMGNGLINTTGSTGDITGTVSDVDGQSYKQWRYGFVPQSLESVVLTITTTDHNQYIVNMKDVVANTVSDNIIANPYTATSSKINRWYPNFSYTYTFHLTKTGIEKVTATLAAWGTVEAASQTVVIQ
jgi:hypothetical protein